MNNKYNPQIALILRKNQNIWDKKIFELIEKRGWDWLYKQYEKINNYDFNYTKSFQFGIDLATKHINKIHNNEKVYLFSSFIQDDYLEVLEFYDFIQYICLINNINIPAFIEGFILNELLYISALLGFLKQNRYELFDKKICEIVSFDVIPIKKIAGYHFENDKIILDTEIDTIDITPNKNNTLKQDSYKKMIDITFDNFEKFMKIDEEIFDNPLNYPRKALSIFLENSFKEAKKINLDLKFKSKEIKFDDNVIKKELPNFLIFNDGIKNNKVFSYALNNQEHYLNIIFDDKIHYLMNKDEPKPILKGLYNSLKFGLYAKGIYLGSYKYKRELINYLKQGKEFLKNFNDDLNKSQIQILDEIIAFLQQDKRIAEYITFKELSKHTKATKKQIKSLLRKVFSPDKAKSYEKIEEKIVLLNKSIKG